METQKHKRTDDFIDVMYSMSMFPTISKPTRITTHSATLIDKIFTNNADSNKSGVLMNGISDHLPVFAIYKCNYKKKRELNEVKYKRVRSSESLSALKDELLN